MPSRRIEELLNEARRGDDYWIADAQTEFTEGLYALMQRRKTSKSELARSIDVSPAYITKILRGSTNFTLASMVRLVRALDGRLHLRVSAAEDRTQWLHDSFGHQPFRPSLPTQRFSAVDLAVNDGHQHPVSDDASLATAA